VTAQTAFKSFNLSWRTSAAFGKINIIIERFHWSSLNTNFFL
jgi:hypothetical protein